MDVSCPWRVRGLQLAAATLLAACGGGDSVIVASVSLMVDGDASQETAPAPSCAIIQAKVRIEAIGIHDAGAQDMVVTLPEPRFIDLLDPGTGVLEALQVAPLTRDAIDVHLHVAGDGTARLEDGTVAPLNAPDILRLSGDFRLAAGMVADLVVQGFDRCGAIQAQGQSGEFVLSGEVPARVRALPDADAQRAARFFDPHGPSGS